MPLVKIELYPGRSSNQKSDAAKAITRVLVEQLGSQPKDVIVIFNDTPAENWFYGDQATFTEPKD